MAAPNAQPARVGTAAAANTHAPYQGEIPETGNDGGGSLGQGLPEHGAPAAVGGKNTNRLH